ncbi:MAG TPA: DUF2975 domain-containing protein [Burkholderiaceae bacterium]
MSSTPTPLPSSGAAAPGRYRRSARWLRVLIALGAGALLSNLVLTWVSPAAALCEIKRATYLDDIGHFDAAARLRCGIWELVPLAVILTALLRLWRLLGEYERDRVFSPRALESLRSFARWMTAAAIVSPLSNAVLSVLATLGNAPGHRQLSVNISSEDYVMLLFGGVVLAISSVMAEAARLAEDNAGFV